MKNVGREKKNTMILRAIFLYLNAVDFEAAFRVKFEYQARKLCNFLQRHIIQGKVTTEKYSRICFSGTSGAIREAYVNSSNALIVEFPIKIEDYSSKNDDELDEYIISLIEIGMKCCPRKFELPKEAIEDGIAKFRNCSYKNEWILKNKKLNNRNFSCTLSCSLTFYEFVLMARILDRDGKIIECVTVLHTEPDEIFFNQYLHNNFYQNGDTLLFKKKDGRLFFEFKLPKTVLTK